MNMLGDAGCARRFQRRAIFALGLCCTMGLMSPLARTDPARNGGRSVAQLADHFSRERLVLVTRRQSRRRDPIAAAALARSVHDRGQTVDFQRRGLPRIASARACFEGARPGCESADVALQTRWDARRCSGHCTNGAARWR